MNMPEELPTEAMINAGLDVLNNGWYINADETCTAIFKAMLSVAPTPPAQELTDTYVQPVPDKCDRITWRGSYYHLPTQTPVAQENSGCEPGCGCDLCNPNAHILPARKDNLRKTAEEAILEMNKAVEGRDCDLDTAVENLRAALRENYGIQAETQ